MILTNDDMVICMSAITYSRLYEYVEFARMSMADIREYENPNQEIYSDVKTLVKELGTSYFKSNVK